MGDSKRNFSGRLVILREINIEQDAPEWFEAMQEPDMHVWTDNKIPNDIDEVRNVVLTTYATHPEIIAWCIRDCETDKMVGIYWIGVPCMSDDGKRITFDAQDREALLETRVYQRGKVTRVQYAFLELGVEEIHAQAWEPNINFCLYMENAGFEVLQVRSHFNSKHNKEVMQRDYVLKREKWERLCQQNVAR